MPGLAEQASLDDAGSSFQDTRKIGAGRRSTQRVTVMDAGMRLAKRGRSWCSLEFGAYRVLPDSKALTAVMAFHKGVCAEAVRNMICVICMPWLPK